MCDCSTLWLYQWMRARTLLSSVVCAGPDEFKGQDIRALKPASFGCSESRHMRSCELGVMSSSPPTGVENLRVSINSDCSNHVVARNGCVRFLCSSSPQVPIQWSRVDGKPLPPFVESCSSASPCAGGERGNGVLVIDGAQEENSGYYVCSASFQNQTSTQVCHVTVGGE